MVALSKCGGKVCITRILPESRAGKDFSLLVGFELKGLCLPYVQQHGFPERKVNEHQKACVMLFDCIELLECLGCRVKSCAMGRNTTTSKVVRRFAKEKFESAASVTRVALRQAGQDSSCERLCSGILIATAAVLGANALSIYAV